MKKIFFSLLLWMAAGCIMAQLPCRTEVLDTNYDGFLFDLPINIQVHDLSDCYGYHFGYWGDSIAFFGSRYYSATPIAIHGIAVTAMDLLASHSLDRYEGLLDDRTPLALMVRDGNQYTVVDSATMRPYFRRQPNSRQRWWPLRVFNYGYPWYGWPLDVVPVGEVYFDRPLLVQDTFYVGFWTANLGSLCLRPACLMAYGPASDTCPVQDDKLILRTDGSRVQEIYNQREILTWGGVFPIIKPYEEDSVFCDTVPNFHWKSIRMGYPTFAWDTDFCREEDLFEVQFAPYRTSDWVTVSTADSSIEVYSVFDPDIYYQARIRARRHHLCPIHDTMMWGPWCDPILFYTGPTEPDTTSAITPVEANGTPFTLTPNPATGTVIVTLGHTPQSLRDSSPNLGEQLVLTLTDAAGHEVLRKELSIFNSQLSITLDLSHLTAGIYLVTLTTPQGSSSRQLVVQ